jgi:hypothetical protein
MICSIAMGKDKFLSPKLDMLSKHVGWKQKKIVASIGIVVGDWYYDKESTPAKNERFYVSRCIEIILNQL